MALARSCLTAAVREVAVGSRHVNGRVLRRPCRRELLGPSDHVAPKSNLGSMDSHALLDGMGNMGNAPFNFVEHRSKLSGICRILVRAYLCNWSTHPLAVEPYFSGALERRYSRCGRGNWIIMAHQQIDKLRLSPLKLEFYSSRFLPKEVADCQAALEQVRPLFSKVMPANSAMLDADLVLSRVKSAVTSSAWRRALIELIKDERNTPRDVILSLVVQESKSLLETGQYHIWRGTLNDDGFAIKASFDIALDELVKSGVIDDARAAKQRAEVAKAIASVG